MRIGIFAGTFDPVHNGHLAFAQAAVTEAQLARVIIVAEKEPYRKKPLTSWDHRQAMIERATEDIEAIDHDYRFASQLAHQHTMQNMLSLARQHYGAEHEYWFLVGSDLFEHMHQWHDVIESSGYGGFVVALRHDHSKSWLDEKLALVNGQVHIPHVQVIPNSLPAVTSTEVRQAVAEHRQTDATPPAVMSYILDHQLYA